MDISQKSIAILVEQQYQEMELWYPKFRFWEEGAEVSLIGPEKGKTYLSKVGYPAEADEAASEVKGRHKKLPRTSQKRRGIARFSSAPAFHEAGPFR